jgi:hypothetical protein
MDFEFDSGRGCRQKTRIFARWLGGGGRGGSIYIYRMWTIVKRLSEIVLITLISFHSLRMYLNSRRSARGESGGAR